MRRIGKIVLTILLIGGLTSRAVFAAIWYESYGKAEEALRAEQWAQAVRYLNEAIELKSDSNARARTYGVNFIAYFPYLKLGTAYYHMGQLEAAARALDREEELQAVLKSASQYAELKRIRGLIKQARESSAADEQERIRGLVTASLEEAAGAEAQGRLEDAIAVVNRALALAPDDRASKDVLSRLQIKLSQAERQREQESRVGALVREGEAFLAVGQFQPAAGKFTEALSIQESPRVRALLEEAQAKLRVQAASGRDTRPREQQIMEVLKAAKTLQADGQLNEALAKLQSALALDPSNEDVRDLQGALTSALAKAAEARSLEKSLVDLLREAEKSFAAGDYEASLAGANRVLSLVPGNRTAIDLASRAIDSLNRRLLGKISYESKPIIIPSDEPTYLVAEGLLAEKVGRPAYELKGSINAKDSVVLSVRVNHYRSLQEFRQKDASEGMGASGRGSELRADTHFEKQGDIGITRYAVPHVLEPGLSAFTISVGDPVAAAPSQTHRYLVYYVPPFYTRGWFYGTVAAFLTLVAGVAYGLKHHNRATLSKRRFNPYIAGAPVLQDSLFFGREQLLKTVLQSVHNNSIMLFGERRIGKTSFQHHLGKRLAQLDNPEYKFYPAFIDLQGVPQERFFSTLREEIFRELAPLLEGSGPLPAPPDGSSYDYRELVDDIRRILKILGARTDRKVKLVLQMDEVDQLNTYDPRVNQRLRSLFMRNFSENLAAVVSGISIQKRWEGEGSPWYNFFEEIEVKPLRRDDAEKLIEGPIRGKFKLERGVTDRILSITDCKPYLVQKMCIALINRMHDEGRRTVTLADVEAVGRPAEI